MNIPPPDQPSFPLDSSRGDLSSSFQEDRPSILPTFEVNAATPSQTEAYSQNLAHEKERLTTILEDSPTSSPEAIQDFSKETGKLHSQIKSKRVSLQESEKWVHDLTQQIIQLRTIMEHEYTQEPDFAAMSKEEVVQYLDDQNQLIDLQSDLIVAQKNTSRLRDELLGMQELLSETLEQYAASISYVNETTIRLGDVALEMGNLEDKSISLTITAEHFENLESLKEAIEKGGQGLKKNDKRTYDFISKRLLEKIQHLTMRMEGSSEERKKINQSFLLTPNELKVLAPVLGLEI